MESTTQIYLDITLEHDGAKKDDKSIVGEAIAEGYQNQIDIDSFSLSAAAQKKTLAEIEARSNVVSNVSFENVKVSKVFDRSSLLLAGALNRHEKFTEAVISVDQQYTDERAKKTRNEILIMTLSNGYIADVDLQTSEGGQGASIKETITLSFESLRIEYYADVRTASGKVTDDYRTDYCNYSSRMGEEQEG